MDRILGSKSVLPGLRFHPTDEELFMYYLKRRLMGKPFSHPMMAEVDVYRFAPWDLPSMSYLKTGDLNWYFLCPREKKYGSGSKANRATEFGYWKSTGNDRTFHCGHQPVGKIKTLVFHRGKPPKGERTNWVMHEYRMEEKPLAECGDSVDAYVICKVYQKSGLGPKNGEQYGAPFVEEEWESDDDDDAIVAYEGPIVLSSGPTDNQSGLLVSSASNASAVFAHSTLGQPTSFANGCCGSAALTPTMEQSVPVETGLPATTETEDELDRLLAMFTTDNTPTTDTSFSEMEASLDPDFFDGLEDLGDAPHCPSVGFNLSQMLADAQRAGEFIELDDL